MYQANDIIQAVKAYIDNPDTKYAIMIDGDWGCGKTHLWKNVLHQEIGKSESIYISMFGLQSINDIENEIFKSISILGTDEEGILKGLLNSNPNIAEDIKFGGLGFAVQFGLKKWKETKIKKSKRLFLCFDDLERWSGDIDICLSYINKLVEHDGVKCLIIGNSSELKDRSKELFGVYKEKTIGFKYSLAYPPKAVIQAAISIANFPSDGCKKFVETVLNDNSERISDLLSSTNCLNIRIVSTAIHYLGTIYSHNREKFEASPTNVVSYFISMLSAIILVEQYRNSDKDRKVILDPSERNVMKLFDKLGINQYEKNGKSKEVSEKDQIIQSLVYNMFYQTSEIKSQGKFGIIKSGFYRAEDFEDQFSEWKATEDYEYYMDTFKFWYLDEVSAERIFKNAFKAIFEDKSITHPGILLLLTDRLMNDIKRGVIDLDFETTKTRLRGLFDELYRQKRMQYVENISLRYGTKRFEYCEDIYTEVLERNKKYLENNETVDLSKFWVKLKEDPGKMEDLMQQYIKFPIFGLYENPEEIVDVIERLGNAHLFELTRWMGSRINEERDCLDAVKSEHERAQPVAKILEDKYSGKFGIRAGHIKQIARVLKNIRTDYDPEYIDQQRELVNSKDADRSTG